MIVDVINVVMNLLINFVVGKIKDVEDFIEIVLGKDCYMLDILIKVLIIYEDLLIVIVSVVLKLTNLSIDSLMA